MYPFVLSIHSILRWVILLLALAAIGWEVANWLFKRDWSPTDRILGMVFSSSLDVQLLVGVILYFAFSPLTQTFLSNPSLSWPVPELRFYGVEHVLLMLAAVALAHLGSILARRAAQPEAKHRIAATMYSLAFLVVLAAIPWSRLVAGIA